MSTQSLNRQPVPTCYTDGTCSLSVDAQVVHEKLFAFSNQPYTAGGWAFSQVRRPCINTSSCPSSTLLPSTSPSPFYSQCGSTCTKPMHKK